MAADILLDKATGVPVGDDQKQHRELTRDIAKKFNHDFRKQIKALGIKGEFFPLLETLATGPAMRVKSLKDGSRKMSKSDASDLSTIYMLDEPEVIAKKIKRATTDAEPLPSEAAGLAGRAEAENLVGIYAALSGQGRGGAGRVRRQGLGRVQAALAELAVSVLGPIAAEMHRLLADKAEMDRILRDGAERARAIALPVMAEVRSIVGFVR